MSSTTNTLRRCKPEVPSREATYNSTVSVWFDTFLSLSVLNEKCVVLPRIPKEFTRLRVQNVPLDAVSSRAQTSSESFTTTETTGIKIHSSLTLEFALTTLGAVRLLKVTGDSLLVLPCTLFEPLGM